MRQELADWPDWRDAEAYRALLGVNRALLAWEWLRRDPFYRGAAAAAEGRGGKGGHEVRPERWGLLQFEPPDRPAPDARPIWSASVYPYVLPCRAEPCTDPDDSLDLGAMEPLLTRIVRPAGRQHLLICDGRRYLRLDLEPGGESRRVLLHYRLAGCASAERPLMTLRRLIGFCRTGGFPRGLYRDEARAARWILQLRAHDALREGCDQREIASVLLSRSAAVPRWRSQAPSLRSQVQRLVRDARVMAGGGFRTLLG